MTYGSEGPRRPEACIAIVGMACQFPDARTPEEFWENLAHGRDSVRDLDDATLRAQGVSAGDLANPAYVRTSLPLEGFDTFDAAFFGVSPSEARIMDPQHRKFIECAWSALEDAGHTPASAGGNIGVFAGSGMHWYLIRNLMSNPDLVRDVGEFLIRHTANDKDFLATRVSYHLDLHGPSVNVQTACSTSLVAVHLACQSLLNGESDLALAGGSTIEVPHNVGYLYRQGEVRSPDGRCRAMDAQALGTGFGSGCGVVVLRRLVDALADGDNIHAVILGSAVNNDGAGKAGYLAPSVDGQAQAIAEAIAVADVDPGTIGYVESHGPGTRIGDPIAVAALTQGFGPTARRQYCALGSVKSNIGHLDTASGVAALIKVALSLRHRKLPPSINFRSPNPEIDFSGSPFHVNTNLADWPALGAPLRAGVGAAGVGGTNVHVVVEEAPEGEASSGAPETPPVPLILSLSAKTPAALTQAVKNLVRHLASNPGIPLGHVAWTLRHGRVPFAHRIAVAGSDVSSVIAQLGAAVQRPARAAEESPRVVFMFPGQGTQHATMPWRLYATDLQFRSAIDRCLAVLTGLGRHDLVAALGTGASEPGAAAAGRTTAVAEPLLFCVEYALAESLLAKGVRPAAMIGHSVGEYVAACLAGIFTLEAALTLTCKRSELISTLPRGSMLAVALAPDRIHDQYLSDGAYLAASNAPQSCVIAGEVEAMTVLGGRLRDQGIGVRVLSTSHALHSPMLAPILPAFEAVVRAAAPVGVEDSLVISSLTGTWLSAEQARSPDYWTGQLRQPVDFFAGMRQLEAMGPTVYVEVGHSAGLSGFASAIIPDGRVISTLHDSGDPASNDAALTAVAGQLWAHGVEIDWAAWGQPTSGKRIGLPTYPFQSQRHWVDPGVHPLTSLREDPVRTPSAAQFQIPDWQTTIATRGDGLVSRVLVFAGSWGVAASLTERLRGRGIDVLTVEMGSQYLRKAGGVVIDPVSDAHWDELAGSVGGFSHLVYLWPVDTAMACTAKVTAGCFDHLVRIGKRIARFGENVPELRLLVATVNAHQLGGETTGNPYQALVAGPVRTIAQDSREVSAKWVDFDAASIEWNAEEAATQLMLELEADFDGATIAWRNRRRFGAVMTPAHVEKGTASTALRTGGCYLITGAFDGVGQVLAKFLARNYGAHLVLVAGTASRRLGDRVADPAKARPVDTVGSRIHSIAMLETCGASVDAVDIDIADGCALAQAVTALGVNKLDGIFHAAGLHADVALGPEPAGPTSCVLDSRVAGTLGLQSLKRLMPDFIAYFSSIDANTAPAEQMHGASANAFVHAFAATADARSPGTRHITVEWTNTPGAGWPRVGSPTPEPGDKELRFDEDALAALESILAAHGPAQIIVATRPSRRPEREVEPAGPRCDDETLMMRGFRVELGEIESALAALPELEFAAAKIWHMDERSTSCIVAYYCSHSGDPIPADVLRAHVSNYLPGYMLPQHFMHLSALPLLPDGQVDRSALPLPRGRLQGSEALEVDPGMPPMERLLLSVCRNLIGSNAVDLDDNFFDAGGHSMLALTMANRIEKQTGVRLNMLKIATGSLRSLAEDLASAGESPPADAPGLGVWLNRWVRKVVATKHGHIAP